MPIEPLNAFSHPPLFPKAVEKQKAQSSGKAVAVAEWIPATAHEWASRSPEALACVEPALCELEHRKAVGRMERLGVRRR